MLYVFLVDTGTMITLDMNLALEKVSYLKGVIARSCKIPPDKQVLLISGGESLEPEETVCKYSAGTDTNPIYLFSMVSIDSPNPPQQVNLEAHTGLNEADLTEKVNASLRLGDAPNTVAIRATLAQEVVKASTEQTRVCELLIHDQRLQHQGWLTVVANLEDLSIDVKKHSERLESNFGDYLGNRDKYLDLIETFDEDIAVLHQIPVFPSLLKTNANPEMSMANSHFLAAAAYDSEVSLLEWINARGSNNMSLEKVADGCYRSLQNLDQESLDELRTEVVKAIEDSKNDQMKEIGGLGERLSGLEQLHTEAKRLVKEQQDLAAAFVQNQQRASNIRDASILPDLCASHRQQLMVMVKNHQQIISVCNRCLNSKNELSANLHQRMKWIVFVQNKMSEVVQKLVMHKEELSRLRRKLDVIEQVHLAPSIYMATAVEVVRRRAFAEQYSLKATSLAEKFSQIYDEEMVLRSNFQAKLKKHFLSKMFPGMDDEPPEFATQKPDEFDHRLPTITLTDVELLRTKFPDLAESLSLPGENALSHLLAKSFNQTMTQEDGEALFSLQALPKRLNMNTRDIGSMSVMNKLISDVASRKTASRMSSALSDSDEMDANNERVDRVRRKKKTGSGAGGSENKLTRSLPHESMIRSTGFTFDNTVEPPSPTRCNMANDPSSSSNDPSSSSAGNTTGQNSVNPSSSSASDGSVMKQQGTLQDSRSSNPNVTSANLGKLAEERAALISSLNFKIQNGEAKLVKLQTSMKTSLGPTHESLMVMKEELRVLREKILEEQAAFQILTKSIGERLMLHVAKVNDQSKKRLSLAMEDAEDRVRKQSESDLDKVRSQLELESQKLEDCHREIEIYRQQLEMAAQEIDKMKTETIEAKEAHETEMQKAKNASELEKAEIMKKMTLEHEIELSALREELENSERVAQCESEVQRLREVLHMKESDVEALRRKTRLLEMSQEEKFHEEKDKIVQILEAGFAQRERLAVEKCEEDFNKKFDTAMQQIRDQHQEERVKWKDDQDQELAAKMATLELEQNTKLTAMIEEAKVELKKRLDEEKELALKQQHQQLSLKAKRELEALRTRFKMMQTAGALGEQRSPSVSECESLDTQNSSPSGNKGPPTNYSPNSKLSNHSVIKSIQSPKQDLVLDSIRSAIVQECEDNMRSERAKWEKEMEDLREEHQQTLVEVMSREKIRDTAEAQVIFNETLNKAMEEKNKQLAEVTASKASLEDEVARLKKTNRDADLVEQLADLGQKNTRLEAELKEAKQKLEQAMACSVMTLGGGSNPGGASDPDLHRLQKENAHLKEQLSKSMLALVSSGKVSVTSVDRGDIVMVMWSEDHNNFSIYTEPSVNLALHFLHNESVQILGLSASTKKYTTAEVVDKEYCQAKKSQNRFKVPQGTKFYRVRCKPASVASAGMLRSTTTTIQEVASNGNGNGNV